MTDHQRSTPLTSAELLTSSCLPPPTSIILPRTILQESIIIHNRHLVLGRAKHSHHKILPLLRFLGWSKVHSHMHRPVVSKKHVLLMRLWPPSPRISQTPRRSPPMRIPISRDLPFLRRCSRDVQQQPLCFCRNIDIAVDVKLSSPPGRIIVEHVAQYVAFFRRPRARRSDLVSSAS